MKKKSKSKKKVDLDAFEKELNESKAKSKTDDAEDDDEGHAPDGSHLENIDEEDLGDDPFARSDAPVGVDAGTEAWLNSDRDYTYEEVCLVFSIRFLALHFFVSYSLDSMLHYTQQIRHCFPARPKSDTRSLLLKSSGKGIRNLSLRTLPISAERCIVRFVLMISFK